MRPQGGRWGRSCPRPPGTPPAQRSTTESTVLESDADRNGRAGIALVNADDNAVREVSVGHNDGNGVVLERAERNELSTVASSGDTAGVALVAARTNALSDLEIDRSGFAGVALGRASANELTRLTVSNTVGDEPLAAEPSAIWLYSASGNRFDDVASEHNEGWTIYARDDSVENRFDGLVIDSGAAVSVTVTDEAVDRDENVVPVLGSDDSVPVSIRGTTRCVGALERVGGSSRSARCRPAE